MTDTSKRDAYFYKRKGDIGYFVSYPLAGQVHHGFSTKLPFMAGSSSSELITRQKRQFCDALRIDVHSFPHLKQVHGDKLLIMKEPATRMILSEYDGVITNLPYVALSVITADCLPILLYEKKKKIIGAVHAGWRGTSLGILQKALTAMEESFQGCLQDCMVLLGPSLRPCCFEIKDDVFRILQTRLPFWEKVIDMTENRFYFNLQLANTIQAREKGVPEENIWSLDLCTFCQPGWFYSYRREGEKAGRMISIISLS